MIHPFRFGDIFLIQRLGRQATRLNIVPSLLHRHSALWAFLRPINPWDDAKATTYILRRQGHGLIGDGFLQVQKRAGRPEIDVSCLAPGLDMPLGHPVIWEKLLSQHAQEAAQQHIERIYADVPDQPLPISTLGHIGFRPYLRQTIWRLNAQGIDDYAALLAADIRPQGKADEWALKQLYRRCMPEAVQLAEGMVHDSALKPPILDWWDGGAYSNSVLVARGEVRGSIQLAQGERGYWLQVWADFMDPDTSTLHQLLRFGLTEIQRRGVRQPVYTSVCEHHGALGAILMDYHFAPVTDRAKMVKHVAQWQRVVTPAPLSAMESVPHVATVPFRLPDGAATPSHAAHRCSPVPAHPSAGSRG